MWICLQFPPQIRTNPHIFACMFTLKLSVKPHIRQFLLSEYGAEPIRIDRETPMGIMLHAFLTKSYSIQHPYKTPEATVTLVIPKHVFELSGHSLHPYQVNMINDFIDGIFRDMLFFGVTMTQATFPTYRESHRKASIRNAQNRRNYQRRYIIQYRKPYIKDALLEGLKCYGITEDMLKLETLVKDYQRTCRRKAENKPSGKTFHPPLVGIPQPSAQIRTLFQ